MRSTKDRIGYLLFETFGSQFCDRSWELCQRRKSLDAITSDDYKGCGRIGQATLLWADFFSHLRAPLPIAIVAIAMLLGIVVLLLLRLDYVHWARVAVAAEVTAVLCAWYAAQGPYILNELGVTAPAAPHLTLVIFLWTCLLGGIVLVPSMLLLFSVFKREPID